jgi:NSS family neurotransmitter:Na+ symporter
LSRRRSAEIISFFVWILGIGSALSFNIWSDFSLIGDRNFLDSMDFIANQILLPLGGMLDCYICWLVHEKVFNCK